MAVLVALATAQSKHAKSSFRNPISHSDVVFEWTMRVVRDSEVALNESQYCAVPPADSIRQSVWLGKGCC